MIVLTLLCCLTAPAEINVDKAELLLGDLIEFSSGDLRAGLSLGNAPNPGLARRLHDYEILGKLQVTGLRTDDLSLPESILIRRESNRLDTERIRAVVTELLQRRFPKARIELEQVTVPSIEVPTGELRIAGSLPQSFNPAGPISVRLDINGPGFSRSAYVQTRANIESPQPVLVRSVDAHSPIDERDIEWQFAQIGGADEAVESPDVVRGMLAKEDLEPGQRVTMRHLYAPVLVRRGDAVTVVAAIGSITVSTTMRARSSGEFGDTIVVENLSGAGQASARVTGQGIVQALVGGK